MPLTLEVVGQKAARMGAQARKTFHASGTIGRYPDNDWVFPDEYISGHHAKITFAAGTFTITDTSTNGVFINSPQNRLTRGQPYILRDGDTLYIDDYEVRVALVAEPSVASAPDRPMAPDDGFDEPTDVDDTDPLMRLDPRSSARGSSPAAEGLAQQFELSQNFRPPPPAASVADAKKMIPENYDPFAPKAKPKSGVVMPRPRAISPAPFTEPVPERTATPGNDARISPDPDCNSNSAFGAAPARATPTPKPIAAARPRLDDNPGATRPTGSLELLSHDVDDVLPTTQRIQMTAYGASQITRRRPFFIQAVFHALGDDSRALAVARIAEPNSEVAQALPLPGQVAGGDIITVRLRGESRVSVDEPVQSLEWRGEPISVQFAVKLPWLDWRRSFFFTIEVDVAGCPVGRCKFRIDVNGIAIAEKPVRAYGSLSRYQRVFLSYASEDAAVVADLAQLIEIQGMSYFMDKLSLRAGSTWQGELERLINSSDLFLLCWSRYAATSEWVTREIEWALRAQRSSGGTRPDIRPFILDGPPIVPPPAALKHLHFNSATRFVKQSSINSAAGPP